MLSEDQEKQLEHLKNASVAAVSMIPLLGSPLSVLMDKYIPDFIEQRRMNLLNTLEKDLRELQDKITPEKLGSEEFSSVFIKSFHRAMEEHLQEKRDAFRYIILNTAISKNSEFDEITLFLRFVSDLTVDQIKILKFLQSNTAIKNNEHGLLIVMVETWPDADPDYVRACVTELLRDNLISSNPEDKEKQGQHYLTGLGKRFIEYISKPAVEIEE